MPMAIIFTCTGGVLGFLAALTAFASGSGLLLALAMWSGAGIAFTLVGLTLALLPRREPAGVRQTA
jgi:hypothetical protein